MRLRHSCVLLLVLWLGGACKPEAPAPAPGDKVEAQAPRPAPKASRRSPLRNIVFGKPQLDQMLAPIALYPDALLAQVLMAATYPGDVAEAARWSREHPKVMGEEAAVRVAAMPWDPSVQALVAFPQTLAMMAQDMAWVQNLGDAYLAQPKDVAASVQNLRRMAKKAGFLASNPYQRVSSAPRRPPEPAPPVAQAAAPGGTSGQEPEPVYESAYPEDAGYTEDLYIEPMDEEMVYVPSYDPNEVYGDWEDDYYLPYYYPPPAGYYAGRVLAAGLVFGLGMAIGDALWGEVDWNDGSIDIDVDRYNRLHVDHRRNAGDGTWRHDPINRDGVPYRDAASRQRYDRRLEGADARSALRGDDPANARVREQARRSMQQGGFDPQVRGQRPSIEDAPAAELDAANARERAMAVERDREREREQQRMQQVERERAANAERERQYEADRERVRQQERQRAQVQERERQASRQRYAAEQQRRARDNAFDGARHPQRSRDSYDRGRASQAHRGGSGSHGGGRQVSRPAGRPSRR